MANTLPPPVPGVRLSDDEFYAQDHVDDCRCTTKRVDPDCFHLRQSTSRTQLD